jgi:hypothetical protein
MPFGGGIRLCVGAEFSKVLIALFLHTLVTNYRYVYIIFWVSNHLCYIILFVSALHKIDLVS